jgi:dimethylargininase
MAFTRAIVRPPGQSFPNGLTTSASLGPPALQDALEQHARYCEALERCGLSVTLLEPDDRFPDATFIEDTAVVTDRFAVLTRPGAPSRRGEVGLIAETLVASHQRVAALAAPATLDGGDVCQVGEHFFIGLSERTNEEGAGQLAAILAAAGHTSSAVDIRGSDRLLHLKSGMSSLGDGQVLLTAELAGHPAFRLCDALVVDAAEEYGANCVAVNDCVLMPDGFPFLRARLEHHGYHPIPLPVSEFRKMDGGLSCLSLRF